MNSPLFRPNDVARPAGPGGMLGRTGGGGEGELLESFRKKGRSYQQGASSFIDIDSQFPISEVVNEDRHILALKISLWPP